MVGGLNTKFFPPGPVAITPTCKKAEMVTCWSETQTTGGLGKHKDGGLLNRKALVPGLQAQSGAHTRRVFEQGVVI